MSKAEDILEKLKRSFNTPSQKDEKIKVVMMCVAISTTFWFFNALNKNDYVTRINYPISIEFDQEAYIATDPLPTKMPIEVSGGGWDLMTRYFGFKMKPLVLTVDDPEQTSYYISSSLRSEIMPEIEPISINYFLEDSVSFKIEKKVSSTVILKYDTNAISLNDNYLRITDVMVSPSKLELIGPASKIAEIGDTLWLKLPIEEVSGDFEDDMNLPELPSLVSTSLTSVQVNFQVVRLLSLDATLFVEKVNFPDTTWRLNPSSITAKFRVPETSFDATDSAGIRVFVDYRTIATDSTLVIKKQVLNKEFQDVVLSTQNVKAFKND